MQDHLLTPPLFNKFRKLIYETCGITLSDAKRTMLSVRLTKRLRALKLNSFKEYYNHLQVENHFEKELPSFLNVVTTNKTDFYREQHHFEYLTNHVVPELRKHRPFTLENPFRIWSAGCSSGEEPYTMAIELSEVLGARSKAFDILATDISTKVLKAATNAVYDEDDVAPIPKYLRHKYLMRGKGNLQGYYKVVPELRNTITFGRLNFNDSNYRIPDKKHVIFCRNVLIYFDEETKAQIISKLCSYLVEGGYLFIGHSETLQADLFNLKNMGPTVYRRKPSGSK